MSNAGFVRHESRISPRFVPPEELSIFFANGVSSSVRGQVKDLSEVGARVLTNAALEPDKSVTIDVRAGYSHLFHAKAKIAWRADIEVNLDRGGSVQGISFTTLSPFSRKLIRRLGDLTPTWPTWEASSHGGAVADIRWDAVIDRDYDLEVFFPASESRADADRFDALSDPVLERLLFVEESRSGVADESEFSGKLGYLDNTDVLQMLEWARATGVLYVEGDIAGELHLYDGRICGCFSERLDPHQAAFRLIVANRGRFRFVPSEARSNLFMNWTTTQLILEAQLRRACER